MKRPLLRCAILLSAVALAASADHEAKEEIDVFSQPRAPVLQARAAAAVRKQGRRLVARRDAAVPTYVAPGPIFNCPAFNATGTNYADSTLTTPRCHFEAEPGSFISLSIAGGCSGAPALRLRSLNGVNETNVAELYTSRQDCRGVLTYMVPSTSASSQKFALLMGCWADESCQGSVSGRIYPMTDGVVRCPAYTAAQTSTASVRTVSCGATALVAGPGDYITIEVGQSAGNPVLKLHDASGVMVADAYGSAQEGAILKYFVPLSASNQAYDLRQGCWLDESCGGTATARIYRPHTVFDAYQNQGTHSFWASAGETVLIDAVEEFQRNTQQTLSLHVSPFNMGAQTQVASATGRPSRSAFIRYTVPADGSLGTKLWFTVKAGCAAATTCRGRVAVTFRRSDIQIRADTTPAPIKWEGWGGSLSWWANVVGASAYQDMYVNLFFTNKTVAVMDRQLPGLGLNIIRYNVGGGAREGDKIDNTYSTAVAPWDWWKDIEGFWLNWYSADPASSSWDWSRDSYQRAVLRAALAQGAAAVGTPAAMLVEIFVNAPMWWMTKELSSAGGALNTWNRKTFMEYIATVVKQARTSWGVNVTFVEPFNEPSAGWWTFPKIGQEGVNIPPDVQSEMLPYLRQELDRQGVGAVRITASDENTVDAAITTFQNMLAKGTAALVDKVNVHSYYGLEPYRNNAKRRELRALLGAERRLFVSEYGDGDVSGMELTQTIMEDITYMRTTGWVYWQVLEPFSGWGLINGNYDKTRGADNGKPYAINNKYYVFAHFTRFLRPGCLIYPQTGAGGGSSNTIFAHDHQRNELVIITLNFQAPQRLRYDLTGVAGVGDRLPSGPVSQMVVTRTNSTTKQFEQVTGPGRATVQAGVLAMDVEPWSIYSTVISLCRTTCTPAPAATAPPSALPTVPPAVLPPVTLGQTPGTTPTNTTTTVTVSFSLQNSHPTSSASSVRVAITLPRGLTFGPAVSAATTRISVPSSSNEVVYSGLSLGPSRSLAFLVTATVAGAATAPVQSYAIRAAASYMLTGNSTVVQLSATITVNK